MFLKRNQPILTHKTSVMQLGRNFQRKTLCLRTWRGMWELSANIFGSWIVLPVFSHPRERFPWSKCVENLHSQFIFSVKSTFRLSSRINILRSSFWMLAHMCCWWTFCWLLQSSFEKSASLSLIKLLVLLSLQPLSPALVQESWSSPWMAFGGVVRSLLLLWVFATAE